MIKFKDLVDVNCNWHNKDLLYVIYDITGYEKAVSITVENAREVFGDCFVVSFFNRKVSLI